MQTYAGKRLAMSDVLSLCVKKSALCVTLTDIFSSASQAAGSPIVRPALRTICAGHPTYYVPAPLSTVARFQPS